MTEKLSADFSRQIFLFEPRTQHSAPLFTLARLHAYTCLGCKIKREVKKMRSWRVAALLFLLGLGLGLLAQAIFTPAHSQNSYEVVSLLRSIDRRLESIERRLDRIERNTDNIYRNFDYVRDWNAVRVRVVR
jgi:hypothetical protein